MNKNNTINKPITVARNEFIRDMLNLINESGLPPFIIEPILKDMYFEIQEASKKQLEYDIATYEKEMNKDKEGSSDK